MIELVIDRTQKHVDRLNTLKAKGWANLSDSEKEEWYGYAAKGAYNYSDLNRVEAAVAEIAKMLGLSLITKTDWTVWDVPTQSDMSRYIGNITAIRNACPNKASIPMPPSFMNALTYETANNIEKVLVAAYRSASTIVRSGEIYSGEV